MPTPALAPTSKLTWTARLKMMQQEVWVILNTFVDFNWTASWIHHAAHHPLWKLKVVFIRRDLRKPSVKLDFAQSVDVMRSYTFLAGVGCQEYEHADDFRQDFMSFKGVIVSSSPTLMALYSLIGRPAQQYWAGLSFFGEDNAISLLCDRFFTGSVADNATVPPKKVALPLPYLDVFNPIIYPSLSSFSLAETVNHYQYVVVMPYVTDAKATWFQEVSEYVQRHLNSRTLFIFKYRKKDQAVADMMRAHQTMFSSHRNVICLDSPYFDLTAELMKYTTKVVFTHKLTQFIKECFFSRAEIEILHPHEKITFYRRMIALPEYDTIFDTYQADKRLARKRHIYDSPSHAIEMDMVIQHHLQQWKPSPNNFLTRIPARWREMILEKMWRGTLRLV